MMKLIGPFSQILTLNNLSLKGSINDERLEIIREGGVLVNQGKIYKIDTFSKLLKEAKSNNYEIEEIIGNMILMPAFVDSHTHICWGGNRANDFAMRIAGKSYLDIAKAGGGILSTVKHTREATIEELINKTKQNAIKQIQQGITTCEVKSGYGLSVETELKMLEAINIADKDLEIDLVPTCLAAHMPPKEANNGLEYLKYIIKELFPKIKAKSQTNRIDIFVEDTAFTYEESKMYLIEAKNQGFDLTIHADQFSTDGSRLACEIQALSADHLENSRERDIKNLSESDVVATVLPGASLGLGMQFAPARKLLDEGCCVAIASDWNPGSAPMGNLLTQASILAAFEKLSTAEVFAGMTFRSAKALKLSDRGILKEGFLADMIAFPTNNYQDILYHQGQMSVNKVWKKGEIL